MGLAEYGIPINVVVPSFIQTKMSMIGGGFIFMRHQPFEYGHPQMQSDANVSAMFPTWFRLLSLALIGQALPSHPLGQLPWQFIRCPGMQFWHNAAAADELPPNKGS